MTFDLDRFAQAQDGVYDQVCTELRQGRKTSHWMWFIFPQLRGLGSSPMALRYGIDGRAEAAAYLAHPLLGQRLRACTNLVLAVQGRSAHAIFGSPDDMKLRSSMTLFDAVAGNDTLFSAVLQKYYAGERDPRTLEAINPAASE